MLALPFDKWILKFQDLKYEPLFEEEQNIKRLLCFRMITISIAIFAVVFLIVFLLQNQPNFIIIIVVVIAIGSFTTVLLSGRLIKYLKLLYSVFYIWTLITSLLISRSGIQIPLFVYGFYLSIILYLIFSFSDNKIKILYSFIFPFINLVMFDQFSVDNIPWIVFTIICSFCGGILAHINEYTARLAFSLNIIAQKQKQIINEFVTDSFFGLSLNERSQQFILEFSNKTFEKYFIKDTNQVKEFLRSYFVIVNEQKIIKDNQKLISLEEYLFNFIKIKEEIIEPQKIQCQQQNNNCKQNNHIILLTIKKIDYCKQTLLISIENERLPQMIEQYENQIKVNINHAQLSYQQLIKTQMNIQHEIQKLEIEKISQKLQLISCLNFKALNQIRNFQLFFSQDKLKLTNQLNSQIQNQSLIEEVQINNYIQILIPYFQTISSKYLKQFILENYIENTLNFKINLKYLTQILFNLFDYIIQHSLSIITLEIEKDININPLNRKHSDSQEIKNQYMNLSVIQFTFIFRSKLMNSSTNLRDNAVNLQEEVVSNTVTNLLLGIIGPYNQYYLKNIQEDIYDQSSVNHLSFYVYSDQSQIEVSFLNNFHH